jgi:hypothetical protein
MDLASWAMDGINWAAEAAVNQINLWKLGPGRLTPIPNHNDILAT